MEWCKLFADKSGKHCWRRVVSEEDFLYEVLHYTEMDMNGFADYVSEIRKYRDKFVAHLDEDLVMNIPHLDPAKMAAERLYHHVLSNYEHLTNLDGLPKSLGAYYSECFDEASAANKVLGVDRLQLARQRPID